MPSSILASVLQTKFQLAWLDRSRPIKKAGIVELLKCSAKQLAGPAGSQPEFTEVYKYLADFSSTVSSLIQYPTLEMRLLIPKEVGPPESDSVLF